MSSTTRGDVRILGDLRQVDGAGAVRVQDRFDTDLDDLCSALTEPRRLVRWLGEVDGDLGLGGQFEARFFATGWEGTGRVQECDPPRRFVVVTAEVDEPDEHTLEVTLSVDGAQTVVVIEERGMPLDQVTAYGAGLQVHIEDLAAHLNGRERCDAQARWAELLPAYQDLPVIGS